MSERYFIIFQRILEPNYVRPFQFRFKSRHDVAEVIIQYAAIESLGHNPTGAIRSLLYKPPPSITSEDDSDN